MGWQAARAAVDATNRKNKRWTHTNTGAPWSIYFFYISSSMMRGILNQVRRTQFPRFTVEVFPLSRCFCLCARVYCHEWIIGWSNSNACALSFLPSLTVIRLRLPCPLENSIRTEYFGATAAATTTTTTNRDKGLNWTEPFNISFFVPFFLSLISHAVGGLPTLPPRSWLSVRTCNAVSRRHRGQRESPGRTEYIYIYILVRRQHALTWIGKWQHILYYYCNLSTLSRCLSSEFLILLGLFQGLYIFFFVVRSLCVRATTNRSPFTISILWAVGSFCTEQTWISAAQQKHHEPRQQWFNCAFKEDVRWLCVCWTQIWMNSRGFWQIDKIWPFCHTCTLFLCICSMISFMANSVFLLSSRPLAEEWIFDVSIFTATQYSDSRAVT